MTLNAHRAAQVFTSAAVLLLATTGLFSAPASARTPLPATAESWLAQVSQISAGEDTPARAAAITARLDALEIRWTSEPFEQEGRSGHNLIADLGGPHDAPILLLGAHYDRVEVGHGANDNASGVAAVLELAQALRARPLPGHRVKLAFWDLEERGLLGARAWVAAPGQQRPALYVNFDIFGWGDTLWMMAPAGNEALVQALHASTGLHGVGFSPGQEYPPTDHLAFLKAGWPAVSFSLVGNDEVASILAVFAGKKPDPAPKVMQVIHSPRDTTDELDPSNLDGALRSLEAGLRSWAQAPDAN
jgi:aminopeptidase S